MRVDAEKKRVSLTMIIHWVIEFETIPEEIPGFMSRTRTGVGSIGEFTEPGIFQSSVPCSASVAEKNSPWGVGKKPPGLLEPEPGLISIKQVGITLVSGLYTKSSIPPEVELLPRKYTFPFQETIGEYASGIP